MRDQHLTHSSPTFRRLAPLLLTAVLLAGVMLTGCTSQSASPASAPEKTAATEINVSGATTLRAAFTTLAPAFEAANSARIVYNFAPSGVLQKQIEGGAPCDVFASASPTQVDSLIAADLVSAATTATFAGNDLVIIVPADNPAGMATPADLTKATRLVTGNPDTAPHGTKAKEFLEVQGTWAALESKFVFAENAAQVLDYVSRGEVDAGFVFASEALGNDTIRVVYTIPEGAIKPVSYVAASVKSSANAPLAEKFVAYLLTPEAQAVLAENGFKPAPPAAP
jgi:molybdate transport system substrate-binding protein